jgi:O-antigen ligase
MARADAGGWAGRSSTGNGVRSMGGRLVSVGRRLVPPAALALLVPFALLLVRAPLLATAGMLGSALLAAVLLHPLAVIGAMLFIGPIDLSWVTGGFKTLFESAGGLDMNGVRLIGVSFGLGVTALLLPQARRALFGRYGLLYVAFLAFGAATLAWSPNPVDGLRLWLKMAYPLLIFALVAGVATERRQLDRLMDYALAGAAVVVVLSLFYTLSGSYGEYADNTVRVRGVALHENPFSFYLLIALYMSFARFAVRGQARYLVLASGLGLWMILTLTRITFLAGAVGMTGIAIYAAVAARNLRMLGGAAALVALIAIPLGPTVLQRSFGYVPHPAELLDLARTPMALYEAINWQGREVAWPVIFSAFLQQPWTGLGLGGSTALLHQYFPVEMGLVAHNEYLRLVSETGVIGFVLFAGAILAWLVCIIQADRRSGGRAREFTLPGIAGIISLGIISITDNAFDYYASYTQFIGLLVAAALVAASLGRDTGSMAGHEGAREGDASADGAQEIAHASRA